MSAENMVELSGIKTTKCFSKRSIGVGRSIMISGELCSMANMADCERVEIELLRDASGFVIRPVRNSGKVEA